MDVLNTELASDFLAAGYESGVDFTRTPHPAECESLYKNFYTVDEGKGYRAYSINIRIFDIQRVRAGVPENDRFVFEAHVRFYGNRMEGADEIPETNIEFPAKSVTQVETHTDRMWQAMGKTYYC